MNLIHSDKLIKLTVTTLYCYDTRLIFSRSPGPIWPRR